MKKLYYVRHGETVFNAEERFAGQIETPLTEKGKKQAKAAGREFKKQGVQIDRIIASPLSRAYDTASFVASELDFPIDRIEKNPLFIERSFGVLEGTPHTEFYNAYTYIDLDNVPGAETFEALYKRASEALAFVQSIEEDTVLIVAHGTFGRAFRRALHGEPHTKEYTDPFIRMNNGEILELV